MKESANNIIASNSLNPESQQLGNHIIDQDRSIKTNLQAKDSTAKQDQIDLGRLEQNKDDLRGGGEPSTRVQTQSQLPMSSGSNKNNNNYNNSSVQNQDNIMSNSNIYSSNQQSPQIQSINYKSTSLNNNINGNNNNNGNNNQKNNQVNNNKENVLSGQNSIDLQIKQHDEAYKQNQNISGQQQPLQQGTQSRIRNQRSDSFFQDESSNLNRSHHNMVVGQESQTTATGMNGFNGNNTSSQIFDENVSAQQQAVFQRIKYLREQIQQLDTHDSLLAFYKSYIVHNPDIITIEEILNSEHVKLKRYKQSVYFGDMINNQRCGKGIMIYHNGRAYEGEWQNDYKFGRGFELYPNGNRYEGYFVNGKSEGMGTYVWANNEIYDGQWLGGMKHGSGMWRGPKGDSYIGEWKFGKTDGYGVHTWLNGDRYEGQFKVCLKHGEGTEKFSNGDYYQGQYVNGRPEGYGEYTWSNNSHYKGSFKNGLRHGQGIWRKNLTDINSDRYEGEYQNDKKCGFGVFRWSSGNEFRGNYFDDLRHGYGEMYWTDGSYYKGHWERGIQSGEGELYMPGEGLKRGLFVNNTFKGTCASDEDQFVNKQQQNLMQYNQQQQLFRENSKFHLSPTKNQSSKSNMKKIRETPNNKFTKMNSISPNSMNSPFKKTPAKSSIKKKIPDSLEKTYGKGGLKQSIIDTPDGRKSGILTNNSQSKNYQSFLQDENLHPKSSKTYQTGTTSRLPFYSKDNQMSSDNNEGLTDRNNASSIQGISPRTNNGNGDKQYKDTANYLRNSLTEEDQSNDDSKSKKNNKNNRNTKNNQSQPYNKIYNNNNNSNTKINSDDNNNQNPLDKRRSISVSSNRQFLPNQTNRNSSVTPHPNKNYSFVQNNNNNNNTSFQQSHHHLPQISNNNNHFNNEYNNNSPEKNRSSNGRKQKQILLKKHEIILWKNLRPKLNLRKGVFKDFTDPITVSKIRTFLHPPVWKPAGISNLDHSPEREQSKDRVGNGSNEIYNNTSSYILTYQKRLKTNFQ